MATTDRSRTKPVYMPGADSLSIEGTPSIPGLWPAGTVTGLGGASGAAGQEAAALRFSQLSCNCRTNATSGSADDGPPTLKRHPKPGMR